MQQQTGIKQQAPDLESFPLLDGEKKDADSDHLNSQGTQGKQNQDSTLNVNAQEYVPGGEGGDFFGGGDGGGFYDEPEPVVEQQYQQPPQQYENQNEYNRQQDDGMYPQQEQQYMGNNYIQYDNQYQNEEIMQPQNMPGNELEEDQLMKKMQNFFYQKLQDKEKEQQKQENEHIESKKKEMTDFNEGMIEQLLDEFRAQMQNQEEDSQTDWYQDAFEEFCVMVEKEEEVANKPPKPEMSEQNFPSLELGGEEGVYEPPKVKVSEKMTTKEKQDKKEWEKKGEMPTEEEKVPQYDKMARRQELRSMYQRMFQSNNFAPRYQNQQVDYQQVDYQQMEQQNRNKCLQEFYQAQMEFQYQTSIAFQLFQQQQSLNQQQGTQQEFVDLQQQQFYQQQQFQQQQFNQYWQNKFSYVGLFQQENQENQTNWVSIEQLQQEREAERVRRAEKKKLKEKRRKEQELNRQKKKERGFKRLREEKKESSEDEALNIATVVIDKTKFIEPDETRVPLNIVFIGHVDCGKSTTCGNILLSTNSVDLQEMKKLREEAIESHRESWYLAYIIDVNQEERDKGTTVEVGKAFFQTKTKRYTILDAPGHKNYVPNMIQGASQADIGALVISARKGEFEAGFEKLGQTTEHALLAKSLGVDSLIIIVNKMDDESVNWSHERYDEIKNKVNPFLRDECGYDTQKKVFWIPISGLKGLNMVKRVPSNLCTWYNGPPLLELFDQIPAPNRSPQGPLRVPILDSFHFSQQQIQGQAAGFYMYGKVESGTLMYGKKYTLLPTGKKFTVELIYNTQDQPVPYALPGENVKVLVKGIKDSEVFRGCVITRKDECLVCKEFIAKVKIINLPDKTPILSPGFECMFHLHTAMQSIKVTKIKGIMEVNEQTGIEKLNKQGKFLIVGQTGVVIIESKEAIACEKYEKMKRLGQFTLRCGGK